jgi:hypothetical protein
MFINKAHWTTEGDTVRISMPIGKVDIDRRMVSGFATLDNVDKQNDIVDTTASLDAFKNFRGNLREMHQPNAVGRIVSFKEDKYFDPEAKKFYSGVYVSAYVSKGAQDTWEKVLDGTLTGFSIGGSINKSEDSFNKELDKPVRIIKEYQLHELSLVDNPANQFANIVSIEKVDGKNQINGYLSKAEISNVFWCNSDDIVSVSEDSNNTCPSCTKTMKNIGFVEKNDSDNVNIVKFLVDSAKGINPIKITKEVNQMTEETTTVVEDVQVAPEADAVTPVEETTEKAASAKAKKPMMSDEEESADDAASETQADEDAEAAAGTKGKAKVSKSDEAVVNAVAEINNNLTSAFSDLATVVKSLHEQVAELSKSLNNVSNEVNTVKTKYDEFGKRVDAVEQDTAFRKSGDLGEIVQESPQVIHKSLWGGRFLKNTDLFN